MPQQDKSAPSNLSNGCSEYEGKIYTPSTHDELVDIVRLAFDYRGDVTLALNDGSEKIGFLYNYSPEADQVMIFITEGRQSVPETIKLSNIDKIDFSGDDKAFGKSWDNWMAKSKSQRQEEAKAIAEEQRELGIL
ncbi:MAG: hypothetical protein AAGA18_07935 [Verrucomicrobiota bacterium]